MFKYFNFLFLLFVSSAIVGQDLTATQKIASNAMPGTEFTIETTINRGTVTGFMKFFQELPEGFTATDIDSKGGSFSFADNGAKIVWLAPPNESVFTVSFKVKVPHNASGSQSLTGKISYINNNERKFYTFEPKSVIVGIESSAIVKTETPKTTPVVETPPVTKPTPPPAPPVVVTQPVVKKELPPPVPPQTSPTFSKVPTSALPTTQGKIYKVQIGAYAAKPKIDGVPEISTLVLDNGITKYFSGKFSLYEDAVKRKKEMLDKGFQGAFIVAFENGQIVK